MTIKEKAKAYDKAIEIAKSEYQTHKSFNGFREMLTRIFPELKESEDKKIMKCICLCLEECVHNDIIRDYEKDKCLAWLEKQGEKSTDEEMKELLRTEYEKGGADAIAEMQGEQKPTDKVEPKFRTGDWVVCYSDIDRVKRVTDRFYHFESGDCGFIKDIDEDYHLWTIQDAKDGDVLVYKDEISLYKHDIKNCTKQGITFGGFVYHCCYDGKRFIMDSLYSLTEQDKMDIHPATKEQRDTLERAITNAGYRWNKEKLKLEKV